ncbi:MAG: ATP-binding protein, partial [Kiritimatiellae bacterium]|nr:ATP-binding protein [Kiritimatiellia bacterium]
RDGIVNLCEMKFSDRVYTIGKSEAEALERRRNAFLLATGIRKAVHVVFVTPVGIVRNKYAGLVQGEVTLADLFAASPR